MDIVVAGPTTPYITPQILTNAPTGISWRTIPRSNATPDEQQAEQLNLCQRATAMIESATNNVLRATVETETLPGPDFRITVNQYTQVVRVELSRYPVTQVLGGQVSNRAAFPRQYSPIPANQFDIERPVLGVYGTSSPSAAGDGGQAVVLAPGYIDWFNGRQGYQLQVQYVSGWPHTSLTAAADASTTSVSVDDCTGWAPVTTGGQGATGIIYDGNNQETVTVTAASATSGPGVLVLSSGLQFEHGTGTVLSALPGSVIWAAVLFATCEALTRGATATTIQTISGAAEPAAAAGHHAMHAKAHMLIAPYRRIV
jgi:hypothetical protein